MSVPDAKLQSLPNFAELPEETIRMIARECIAKSFQKGQNIYSHVPDETGRFYIILSGKIEIYHVGGGKKIVIQVLEPGDFFGDLSFAGHSLPFAEKSYARAKTSAEVCSISNAEMKLLLHSSPPFTLFLLTMLRDRLHHAESKIKDLAVASAETRIINELLRHAIRHGNENGEYWEIGEKITHQSLAEMTGVARETATKILNALEKENVISWKTDGSLRLHRENIIRVCPQCLSTKTFSSQIKKAFHSISEKTSRTFRHL